MLYQVLFPIVALILLVVSFLLKDESKNNQNKSNKDSYNDTFLVYVIFFRNTEI